MANTGYKQATVAYKVSNPGGEAVDIYNNLVRLSGQKQAIALLNGHSNPNPDQYEVESYFTPGQVLDENPTKIYDPDSCPVIIETPTTEIEFEVTTTEANQSIPDLIRMSSTSDNGTAIIVWDVDNNISETVNVPKGIPQSQETPDGDISWIEGNPYGHTYAIPRTYRVKITSYSSVDALYFSTREFEEGEWSPMPVIKPYITKMVKFKSSSLKSLYYTFAGLSNMQMDSDFVLETPEVDNISFAFCRACRDIVYFIPPANLLSQITKPIWTYRTFMQCGVWDINSGTYISGMTEIPEGFMDSLTNLSKAFEFFKQNPLGANRTPENIDSYIPVTLLHKLTKLTDITGLFNACIDTHGNYPSGYSLKPTIKKDFFKNTKIRIMDYAFGKWNRVVFEPDVFGHIKDTLESMEGVFHQCNQTNNQTGWGGIKPGTTNDLQEIFPAESYPNVKNMIGAFSPFGDNNPSFNTQAVAGIAPPPKLNLPAFITKFPNAKSGSIPNINHKWGTDGRRSAFGNLQNVCDGWDTVAAIDDGIWTSYVQLY